MENYFAVKRSEPLIHKRLDDSPGGSAEWEKPAPKRFYVVSFHLCGIPEMPKIQR